MKPELGVRSDKNNNDADAGHPAVNSYLDVENRLRKKAKLGTVDIQPRGGSPTNVAGLTPEKYSSLGSPASANHHEKRSGRWSLDEKIMFLYGLSLFGKGRWKKISAYVPDRSLVQIKSHAQKVLKRLDAGENVFRRLEDNQERLKVLVAEANQRIKVKEARTNQLLRKKRKRASTRKPLSSEAPVLPTSWEDHPLVEVEDHALSGNDQKETNPAASPVPSLASAPPEDPPGLYGSPVPWDTNLDAVEQESGEASSGAGAVIAAVAALCQLSASDES